MLIAVGSKVLFSYAAHDSGLRNVAAATLTELGFTGRRVAQVLGITEVYVSRLRTRARVGGSAALLPSRGRPSALRTADLKRARAWRAAGQTDTAITVRLGVHATTVGRALAGDPQTRSEGNEAAQTPLPLIEPTVAEPDDTDVLQPDTDDVFNAEAWLAEHFNAYLIDPNEYRAILRHLLRLGGQIDYTSTAIIVTLDRPDSPRVARALTLLAEELTALGASPPGDPRTLTYQLTAAEVQTVTQPLLAEV